MKLIAFKCDACGQMMSETVGPSWTVIDAPAPPGSAVVVLTCLNVQCGKVLGAYLVPAEVPSSADQAVP